MDLFTACGFHAMRALEAEARDYHAALTGIELENTPLGPLINGDSKTHGSGLRPLYEKEKSPKDSPLGLIISLLSQINSIYRRPLMHPEMDLNARQAKFVFDVSAMAIDAMVVDKVTRFMEKKKASGAVSSRAT